MKKFRKFKQNKLWRDKLVDFMEQNYGSRIQWHRLNDKEFDEQIRIKLLEETQEVISTQNRTALLGELADLYEVIDSLAALHKISKAEIIAIQTNKREERGSFAERKFVEIAEHPVGSFGEQYCLADPKKYQELL